MRNIKMRSTTIYKTIMRDKEAHVLVLNTNYYYFVELLSNSRIDIRMNDQADAIFGFDDSLRTGYRWAGYFLNKKDFEGCIKNGIYRQHKPNKTGILIGDFLKAVNFHHPKPCGYAIVHQSPEFGEVIDIKQKKTKLYEKRELSYAQDKNQMIELEQRIIKAIID